MFLLLAMGIVNEYLSSLVMCLHQMRECVFVLLAMGIVNEYLSSLVKCVHQIGDLPSGYQHSYSPCEPCANLSYDCFPQGLLRV